MSCEYCHGEGFHNSRCPLYVPKKPDHYCSICGEGIFEGEKYIVNDNNDYRHYDCFCGLNELLNWLGYDVQIMK